MLFFLGYELIHHFKKGILLLFISILMFVFLLVSPFKHLAFERMSSTQFYLENNSSTNLNERFPRLIVWENTIEIIKENELFGVGIANTNEVLKTRYEQIGFGKGLKGNFNAHNQFLEVLLASGWIGLASLWSIFMFLIYKAIIYKSHYMLHFLAIIIFYMSIESYFESQMGLFAFVLIASVLLHKCTIHVQ